MDGKFIGGTYYWSYLQKEPCVMTFKDGKFIISWMQHFKGSFHACGQLFAKDGTKLGSEFRMIPKRRISSVVNLFKNLF